MAWQEFNKSSYRYNNTNSVGLSWTNSNFWVEHNRIILPSSNSIDRSSRFIRFKGSNFVELLPSLASGCWFFIQVQSATKVSFIAMIDNLPTANAEDIHPFQENVAIHFEAIKFQQLKKLKQNSYLYQVILKSFHANL